MNAEPSPLSKKRILLGVTGSIAAYKSAELVRLLVKNAAEVRVVMTQHSQQFICPMTLQALSGNTVHDQLFDRQFEAAMGHIELAKWADILLIAPATANILAKLTHGLADDLLSTLALATTAKQVMAPAMNQQMWQHPATQANLATLAQRGVDFVGPDAGEQACGDVGAGRMLEPQAIVEQLAASINLDHSLDGKHVVITTGATQEAIDPVRYLSNHSSGKMGVALANAAKQAGAKVDLIAGMVNTQLPQSIAVTRVLSTQAMLDAALGLCPQADIFISAAAVSDYRVAQPAEQKIKKHEERISLMLEKNPDIVATISASYPQLFTVGFAAETENLLENARSKLQRKQLSMIVANDVSHGKVFGQDESTVTLIDHDNELHLPQQSKSMIAQQIIQHIAQHIHHKG